MNKTLRTSLICFGINMLFVGLLVVTQRSMDSFVSIGLFWLFSLILQFVFGLIFVFQARYKEMGKGILLGALLGLLIGFSVCSVAIK